MATTVPLFAMVGKDFMPHDDQSEFEVTVKTPEGFSLQRTDETLRGIEARLRELPHVTHLLTTIGDVSGRLRAGEGPVTHRVDLRAARRARASATSRRPTS